VSMAWDGAVLLWLQNVVRSDGLTQFMAAYTHMGDSGLLFIIIAVGLLCFPKTRKAGLTALTALLIGFLLTNQMLKPLVGRPRPWEDIAGLLPLVEEHSFSFPSGHTTSAFAFAGALLLSLPVKWGKAAALGAAVLMGFSRLYVAAHYPTDVLGGVVIGLLAGWIASLIWKKMDEKKKR